MLIIVVAACIVLAIISAVIVALQSPTFRITRSMAIAASPATVFPLINDFQNWAFWSPWEKMDPAMIKTYKGPPAGAGAIYTWSGNKKVGKGKMEITGTQADESVTIRVEFLAPFKATNTTLFKLVPLGDQSQLTWAMSGNKNFVFKAIHMLINMDKMIGADFERGLLELKLLSEKKACAPTE